MIIARIETQETRIFPTKTKTNFSCCFQLISPEEYLMRNYYSLKDKREKFIKDNIAKIHQDENKFSNTPANLLEEANAGRTSERKASLKQMKNPFILRATESPMPAKIDRNSPIGKSKECQT